MEEVEEAAAERQYESVSHCGENTEIEWVKLIHL